MRTGVTVELSASDRQHLCGDREVSEQSTEASLAGTDRPAHGRRLRHSGDHAPDRHQRDSGLALADIPFVSADRYRPRRQPERRSGYARTPAGATPAKMLLPAVPRSTGSGCTVVGPSKSKRIATPAAMATTRTQL
jgi:hypothetical protein